MPTSTSGCQPKMARGPVAHGWTTTATSTAEAMVTSGNCQRYVVEYSTRPTTTMAASTSKATTAAGPSGGPEPCAGRLPTRRHGRQTNAIAAPSSRPLDRVTVDR